uniref:Amino acid transporter n=1 Tax=Solanum tuberosum TaxID=4113 RepID=M1BAM1_SOLTU
MVLELWRFGGGLTSTHDPHLWGMSPLTARGCPFVVHAVFDSFLACPMVLLKELWGVLGGGGNAVMFRVKAHFENVQRIADSTTLPHVVRCLRSQIEKELDLTHLTERLMKGKDLPNSLTAAQKLELWDRLKIISFTRMVLSLWAATLLSLYIRVQVNILGRHLYIDTARGIGGSGQFDEIDLIDRNDQQQFLASADYLTSFGLPTLISSFEGATSEVLKGEGGYGSVTVRGRCRGYGMGSSEPSNVGLDSGLRALLIGKNGFRPLARSYWISSHVEIEPRSGLNVLIGDMLMLILTLPGTSLKAFITIPISHENHYEVYVGLFGIPLLAIKVATSAMDSSHSVTSGVYKARSIDDKSCLRCSCI